MHIGEKLFRILILSIAQLLRINGAVKVSVCPLSNSTNDNVSKLRNSLLCDIKIDCGRVKRLLNEIHTSIVIVLRYDGDQWTRRHAQFLDNLSFCGNKLLVVNSMANVSPNLAQFCSNTTKSVIFTERKETELSETGDEFHQDECSTVNVSMTLGKTVEVITASCPRTIWVLGPSECSGNVTVAHLSTVKSNETDHERRWKKKTIKIATIVENVFVSRIERNGALQYVGPIVELLDLLASKHNFSYELQEAPDGKYGNVGPNGTWDGLIGMLIRKEADVAAVGVVINFSRRRFVDYTEPFMREQYGLLFRKPEPVKSIWNILRVFSVSAWALVVLSALVAVLLLHIIHKLSVSGTTEGFDTVGQTVWYVWSSLMNQGMEVDPESWAARNFLAFWWIYVVAILAVFGGSLVARLSSAISVMPFSNVAELGPLVDQGKFKLCVVDGTSTSLDIKQEIFNEYKLLNAQLIKHPEFLRASTTDCMNFMLNDKSVVYIDNISQQKLIQMYSCSFAPMIILPMPIGKSKAFALQKGSTLNQMFSSEIVEFVGAGIFNFWQEESAKKFGNNSFCDIPVLGTEVKASTVPLNVDDMFISFITLMIGSVIGVIGFCFEMFFSHVIVKKSTRN